MKKTKTYTYIPEKIRQDRVFAYGHALWSLSLIPINSDKIQELKNVFNVGTSLSDEFVNANILKKEKRSNKLFFIANQDTPPTKEQCLDCYKKQTLRVNNSKLKANIKTKHLKEPKTNDQFAFESLAETVNKLHEIVNKLVN
jgi:hypothetical protein